MYRMILQILKAGKSVVSVKQFPLTLQEYGGSYTPSINSKFYLFQDVGMVQKDVCSPQILRGENDLKN